MGVRDWGRPGLCSQYGGRELARRLPSVHTDRSTSFSSSSPLRPVVLANCLVQQGGSRPLSRAFWQLPDFQLVLKMSKSPVEAIPPEPPLRHTAKRALADSRMGG
jgi:hypothetical protein